MQRRRSDPKLKKKYTSFIADVKESNNVVHKDKSVARHMRPHSGGVSILGKSNCLDLSIGRIFRDEFGKNLKMPRISSGGQSGRALSVLIIDDSIIQRKLTMRTLGGLIDEVMWMVEGAENGECALNLMETSPRVPDVIIVDQYMETSGGQLLGHEVVAELRRNSAFDTAVIIGCTSSAEEAGPRFLESGCDAVWSKPMPSKDEAHAQILEFVKKRKKDSFFIADTPLQNLSEKDTTFCRSEAELPTQFGPYVPTSSPVQGAQHKPIFMQTKTSHDIDNNCENVFYISDGSDVGSVFRIGVPPALSKSGSNEEFSEITESLSHIDVNEA